VHLRSRPFALLATCLWLALAAGSADAESGAAGTPPENAERSAGGDSPAEPAEPSSPSAAEPDRMRAYVWVGGMNGFDVKFADSIVQFCGLGCTPPADVDPGIGFSLRFGGRGRHVGVEAEADFIRGFDVEHSAPTFDELDYYSRFYLGLNLRLYPWAPSASRIHPNVIVGGGWDFMILRTHALESWALNGGSIRAGAGVDFDLTDRIALSIDSTYVLPFGQTRNSDYVTLGWGVLFRF